MKQIKSVSGIRNKILYGFFVLGCLLFFSGLISFFELRRLNASTRIILEKSRQEMEMSDKMVQSVKLYDSILQVIMEGREFSDSLLESRKNHFDSIFTAAAELFETNEGTDRVIASKNSYDIVANDITDTVYSNIEWIEEIYRSSYYDLNISIKNLILSTNNSVDNTARILRNNAYRAIMPGIITLGIAIIIIVVFFGLIDLYYIKPVLKMTRSLEAYIKQRVPFKPKVEGTDEIKDLRTYIEELISSTKKVN
ncbi:MAG: hypothetical protein LUF90_04365 [Rikenellaceae bacterium]|nr:hypothetical protein [Rikenellaceae bacterium]